MIYFNQSNKAMLNRCSLVDFYFSYPYERIRTHEASLKHFLHLRMIFTNWRRNGLEKNFVHKVVLQSKWWVIL
jgi:hypothetical protein